VNYCYYSPLLPDNIKFKVFRTIYVCEMSSVMLRADRGLKVFGNKLLRKVLGHKKKQVTKHWRKLHGTELHGLYSSPDIISVDKKQQNAIGGTCGKGAACRISVGNVKAGEHFGD
jgi:hypothetical protein